MKKLKLFLTLLLLCAGVNCAMAQGNNVTIAVAPSDGNFVLGTKWYTIHDGHGAHYLGTGTDYIDDKGFALTAGPGVKPTGEAGYWCVVGDATNGYQFYNRAEGTGNLIGILKDRTAEVTVANMYETTDTTVDTHWDFTQSSKAAVNGNNYWCIKVHGTDNNYWTDGGNTNLNGGHHLTLWYSDQAVYGWGKNASNGTGDDGSAFLFEIAATELEVNFVNNGTTVSTVRKAVPQETTIQTFAEQNLPTGYAITGTVPTKADGTYSYNVNVTHSVTVSGIKLTYVDYITGETVGTQDGGSHYVGTTIASFATTPPTGYKVLPTTALVEADKTGYNVSVVREYTAQTGIATRNDEYWTSYVTLQVGKQTQKLTGLQSAKKQEVYYDLRGTDKYFTCPAGALITPALDATHMNAMQGYCYVDMNYDGTFSYTVNTDDHCADPNSDLKAWSGHKFSGNTWYNSKGEVSGMNASMPAFTAPTTPGVYCMRFKCAWDNIDPNGNTNLVSDGGIIVDVFLVVTPSYTATYQDGEGNPVENAVASVSSGTSALNEAGQNVISVGSDVAGILCSTDFQMRDVVAINGAEATLADLSVSAAGDELTVTLAEPYIKPGKYYTIKNVATSKYAYDNPSGTDDGNNLNGEAVTTGLSGKHFFQFVAANPADGGIKAGSFYIQNAETKRFVKTPSQISQDNQALKTKEDRGDFTNFAYWITNAVKPGDPEAYVIADAKNVSNPTQPITDKYTWNTNSNITAITRWKSHEGTNLINGSLWKIQEVPVITITFQDSHGNELTGITFTADGSLDALRAQNKVLATVRNFDVSGYAVVGRQLKAAGSEIFDSYPTRADFYTAVAGLTEDAEAIITLRPRTDDELDVTIDLYSHRGEYWKNGAKLYDGNTSETGFTADEWHLTETIDGVPADLDLKVTVVKEGTINARIHNYFYTGTTDKWGIGFEFPTDYTSDNKFNITVKDGYYILQYEMSQRQFNSANDFLILNEGESTASSEQAGTQYNITDTPAKSSTWFQLTNVNQGTDANVQDPYTTAVFFRVRIVNEEYLKNSRGHGRSICERALNGGVGYPKKSTQQWEDLKKALDDFDANDNDNNYLTYYCAMLQAYSRYISCRVLETGDDCAVYTLSFIKNNGDKVLIKNGDDGLEIAPYTEANRADVSARWISHKNEETGKMVFVSKKDGKYLQAKTASESEKGLSTYYDAGTTAFTVEGIHQDINDYMQSATDEKLLGAVYLKSAARVTDANRALVFTMQNSNNTWNAGDAPRFDDYTTAIAIEEVENGNTFNEIDLKPANDGNYYATYYGFYPVAKPDGVKMYYVNSVEDGVMELVQVQAEVIRPNFAVILISEGNGNLYGNGNETHLHIGEYTTDVENKIASYLTGKQNLLQGTVEEKATSEATTLDGHRGTVYVLSGKKDNKVGFYPYTAANLPIGRAYYVHPETTGNTGTEIRAFHFTDENGVETTVELNPAETSADAVIYDLSGRRVNNATHGLFIINGKKVIK